MQIRCNITASDLHLPSSAHDIERLERSLKENFSALLSSEFIENNYHDNLHIDSSYDFNITHSEMDENYNCTILGRFDFYANLIMSTNQIIEINRELISKLLAKITMREIHSIDRPN